MRAEDLARLTEVASMLRERDLARLAAVRAEIADIDRQIAVIDEKEQGGADEAHLAAAGLARERWHRWAQGERRRLQVQKAALSAEEIVALETARRSVGRDDVLRRIAGT